jgi:4-hydroxy-tetrahydrodipicolinate reductase
MAASEPLNTVIIGAGGRMGRALARAVAEIPARMRISAAVASTTSASLGKDFGELAGLARLDVRVTDDLAAGLEGADVVIDFSQPHATRSNLTVCRAARKPLLIGTTGFAADLGSLFDDAAREIPLLVAPNTSIGVTLLLELTRIAAKALPADFDIEIVEAHHRMKKDAPSGTALALGTAAARGRGHADTHPKDATSRIGDRAASEGIPRGGERPKGEVGYAVIRGGDIVGEHTVLFAGTGEQVTLGHRATDRAIFARGAVQAASWLAGQAPGRYFMSDFLGLNSIT